MHTDSHGQALGVSACEMLSSLGGMHAPGVYIHLAPHVAQRRIGISHHAHVPTYSVLMLTPRRPSPLTTARC